MAVDIMYAQEGPTTAFGTTSSKTSSCSSEELEGMILPAAGEGTSSGHGSARKTMTLPSPFSSTSVATTPSHHPFPHPSSSGLMSPSTSLPMPLPASSSSTTTAREGGGGGGASSREGPGGAGPGASDALGHGRSSTFPRRKSKDRKCSTTTPVDSIPTKLLLDTSWTEEEKEVVGKITSSRRQLEGEIEELIGELTRIGEEMDCMAECIQIVQDNEECPTKKNLRRGRKLFNSKPKEGIQFLRDQGLLNVTPEDIALFLFSNQLDKVAIGEYLGGGNDFNIRVLQNFVSLHDFCGQDLVKALRSFLDSFQLPGEAQKIDRMMEFFAHRYCDCNPTIFSSTDTCYILSFSIIMLNTSLHNPNVKEKPTVERFISMNRDINAGKELPHELLKSFYESIKTEPFQFHKEADEYSEMFFNADYRGWLTKEGGRHKSWKKRWFILTDNCLYYFKSPEDREPRGIIPLVNLDVKECSDIKQKKGSFCFEIVMNDKIRAGTINACKTQPDGKVVVGKHINYRIQAASEDERQEWMRRIRASISRNPFLEMLQQRRLRVAHKGPVTL